MSQPEVLQALLADCARQDHSAFERLYRLTAPRLYALCLQMLRRKDLAEEVLQDAFVQIWRNAATFDPSRGTPMTWLAVIVRHRALDMLRRQRPELPLDEGFETLPDMGFGSPEAMLGRAESHALHTCLGQLSQQQRECILLAFFQGLTHNELSESLSKPIGTIKSWIRRGLEQLRRCLQE
jgi:RNA polymerase sigma-70 factor, ECF subfamily